MLFKKRSIYVLRKITQMFEQKVNFLLNYVDVLMKSDQKNKLEKLNYI